MNKSLIALALAGAFAVPAFAQTAASEPAPAAEASPHTLTGNLGLFSRAVSITRIRAVSMSVTGTPM